MLTARVSPKVYFQTRNYGSDPMCTAYLPESKPHCMQWDFLLIKHAQGCIVRVDAAVRAFAKYMDENNYSLRACSAGTGM